MKDKVLEIVSAVVGKTKNELESNLNTEGLWDSFTNLEIVLNLESELGISFEQDEVACMKTLNKIIELVTKKGK